MKCYVCKKNIDEAGVMYTLGRVEKRCVCPTCFITSERHTSVKVVFHWGVDDNKEAEG